MNRYHYWPLTIDTAGLETATITETEVALDGDLPAEVMLDLTGYGCHVWMLRDDLARLLFPATS